MLSVQAIRLRSYHGWEEPVSVQVQDNGEVWSCNHHGAVEEESHNEVERPDGSYIEWSERVLVCDKCPAWKLIHDDEWHDAPFGGRHDA